MAGRISIEVDGLAELIESIIDARLARLEAKLDASHNGTGVTRWFNTKSAAVYMDTTEVGVRSLIDSGKLRPFRNGSNKYAFTQAMLDEHQQRNGRP